MCALGWVFFSADVTTTSMTWSEKFAKCLSATQRVPSSACINFHFFIFPSCNIFYIFTCFFISTMSSVWERERLFSHFFILRLFFLPCNSAARVRSVNSYSFSLEFIALFYVLHWFFDTSRWTLRSRHALIGIHWIELQVLHDLIGKTTTNVYDGEAAARRRKRRRKRR